MIRFMAKGDLFYGITHYVPDGDPFHGIVRFADWGDLFHGITRISSTGCSVSRHRSHLPPYMGLLDKGISSTERAIVCARSRTGDPSS